MSVNGVNPVVDSNNNEKKGIIDTIYAKNIDDKLKILNNSAEPIQPTFANSKFPTLSVRNFLFDVKNSINKTAMNLSENVTDEVTHTKKKKKTKKTVQKEVLINEKETLDNNNNEETKSKQVKKVKKKKNVHATGTTTESSVTDLNQINSNTIASENEFKGFNLL
jgi:hypothetical protein